MEILSNYFKLFLLFVEKIKRIEFFVAFIAFLLSMYLFKLVMGKWL